MKKFILPFVLSPILVFTGCTTIKISDEYLQKIKQAQVALKTTPVAILVNSCFTTNELGKDQILVQPSSINSQKFTQTLTEQLNQHGVQITNTASPFICGLMSEEQLKKYDVLANQETKRSTITTYPLINQSAPNMTDEQKNAVLQWYQFNKKRSEIELENLQNKKETLALPQLNEDTENVLKNWAKSPYILVVSLDGLDASLASKLALGSLSFGIALATMGAGSGLITTYVPHEGQHYTIQLYDINKKEYVWINSAKLNGNVFSTKNNSLEAKNILNTLFEPKTK